MRIDPGKGWPHPVLRPPKYGDDYPNAEFQVEIECRRAEGGYAVDMTAEFELSDPDLLRLVHEHSAEYVLVVKSPRTHFRKEFRPDAESVVGHSFSGEISGRVEFSSFLVCVERQPSFSAQGWHSDFNGLTFDIAPGAVLAEDEPKEYWIDAADEAPIGAIFEHIKGGREDGQWNCNLDYDRIQIQLSDADSNRFMLAREGANNTAQGQYLMNGLYLPVLIHVMNEADKNAVDYAEYRWFTSLNNRLEVVGCKELGSESVNRAIDAQKVLEHPFIKMPMIAEAEI